jgi:hypothetical protein
MGRVKNHDGAGARVESEVTVPAAPRIAGMNADVKTVQLTTDGTGGAAGAFRGRSAAIADVASTVAPSAAKKVRIAWSRLQLRTYGRASILGGSELVGTTNAGITHCVVFRQLKSADCHLRSAALWLQT